MITVTKKDNLKLWIEKTNLIPIDHGELDNLNTTIKSSLVESINEKKADFDGFLSTIHDDKSPQLGDDLDVNNHDIMGVGNININGYMDVALTTSVTGVTTGQGDSSTKIATTEFTDLKISTAMISANWGSDLSGTIDNADIDPNTIGTPELDKTTQYTNGIQQFPGTDGAGNLIFINIAGGQDLSGPCESLEIESNKIGIPELDIVDGTQNHIMTTDGAGTLSFKPSVTLSSITPNVGEQTFNINYIVDNIFVYMNGIKLINGQDFTANNGTSVSLTNAVSTANTTIDFQLHGI